MKKVFVAEKKGNGSIRCIMVSSLGSVYTGKAVCSPNDDFSLEKGMEIAEKRAKLKQLNRIFENTTKMRQYASQKLRQIENREDKLAEKIWELETELEELCITEADE